MSVTISGGAYEALITEQDVINQQHERKVLADEIKILEYAIRGRQKRIAEITSTLCLIQLSASHQLQCRHHQII